MERKSVRKNFGIGVNLLVAVFLVAERVNIVVGFFDIIYAASLRAGLSTSSG